MLDETQNLKTNKITTTTLNLQVLFHPLRSQVIYKFKAESSQEAQQKENSWLAAAQ